MNWKKHLFKPPWQHRDAERRKEAVSSLNDPELLQALPQIMIEDEDVSVRMAAARRVNDIDALRSAQQASSDASYSDFLQQRMQELVCHPLNDRPGLQQRREFIRQSDDRPFLERIAAEAAEAEIRSLALSAITRQGFLGDRAIHDPDPAIRRQAAAAITRHATLKRVIEETRTRDKSLHSALQERLHHELLLAGDPEQVAVEALDICKQLESFALAHQREEAKVPRELDERWQRIRQHVRDELVKRHANAVQRIESALPEAPAPVDTPVETIAPAGEPGQADAGEMRDEPATAVEQNPLVEKLRARIGRLADMADDRLSEDQLAAVRKQLSGLANELRAEFGETLDQLERRLATAREKTDRALEKAASLLGEYEQQLTDGALHKALEIRQQIRKLGEGVKGTGRWKTLSQQMSTLHGRLKELRDWQHWSNDKVRKELIREMELLPKADLHPDALLSRVQSLQGRWKELEQSEQIPGDPHFAAAPWMWRKFQAAGNAAFEAAKPFLDKRSEIQKKREQESLELASRLRDLAGANPVDWPALRSAMGEARKQLRDLDSLPHSSRRKAANGLRKALSVANDRMQAHYEEIEKEKRKLIRAAEQLAYVEDRKEAVDQAKRLQADWKRAGSLWRGRENALWKEFRKPLDPLFEDLQQEKEAQQQAFQERIAEQGALVAGMKAILEEKDETLEELRGKVQGLVDQWRDIEHPDRKLRKSFDTLTARFESRLREFHTSKERAQQQRWWVKADILHELESGLLDKAPGKATLERLRKKWPDESSGHEVDKTLDRRFEAAFEAADSIEYIPQTAQKARSLCIQLEFLSGLSSPESDREERMQYQVDRLSRSMSGDLEQQSAEVEAQHAEQDWLTLEVLKPGEYAQYRARIEAALKQLSEINND